MYKKTAATISILFALILMPIKFSAAEVNLSIGGKAFDNTNSNSMIDPGEGNLVNWRIYIDNNQNGSWEQDEPAALTDSLGNFSFSGLLPGTYHIRQVQQSGWIQTQPPFTQDFEYALTLN